MPDEMPEERQPIPLDAIRRIQRECMTVDDENRWLLALISDTGYEAVRSCWAGQETISCWMQTYRISLSVLIRGGVSRQRAVKG
jgi:hypothetical protein